MTETSERDRYSNRHQAVTVVGPKRPIVAGFDESIFRSDKSYGRVAEEILRLHSDSCPVHAIVAAPSLNMTTLNLGLLQNELRSLQQALAGWEKAPKFDNASMAAQLLSGEWHSVDSVVYELRKRFPDGRTLGVKQGPDFPIQSDPRDESHLYGTFNLRGSEILARKTMHHYNNRSDIVVAAGSGGSDFQGRPVLFGKPSTYLVALLWAQIFQAHKVILYGQIENPLDYRIESALERLPKDCNILVKGLAAGDGSGLLSDKSR